MDGVLVYRLSCIGVIESDASCDVNIYDYWQKLEKDYSRVLNDRSERKQSDECGDQYPRQEPLSPSELGEEREDAAPVQARQHRYKHEAQFARI